MPEKKVRHILGLSGGKDSTALAVYLAQHKKIKDIEFTVLNILRMGIFQFMYMDKVPPYSIVN